MKWKFRILKTGYKWILRQMHMLGIVFYYDSLKTICEILEWKLVIV